jgi:hypothetical protein
MKAKLTLTVEEELIEFGKEIAKEQRKSLSELLEDYLRALRLLERKAGPRGPQALPPITRRLRDMACAGTGAREEDDYKHLEEKYGR